MPVGVDARARFAAVASMKRKLLRNVCCEAGASAIEYSLIAGMVALVIIATLTQVGAELLRLFQELIGQF